MSKSNFLEKAILRLVFCATGTANLFDNAASSPITVLWGAMHTADPTDAGTQGSNEAAYTGYTRISVARTTAGFVVSTADGTVSPVAAITFPQATSTSTSTLTHFSFGMTSATTGGEILYSGTLTPNVNIGLNVQPRVTTGSSATED